MILVRDKNGFVADREAHAHWNEQKKVEDIDALVENMGKALDSDERNTKSHRYEVIEVEVVRRYHVERRVEHNVVVETKEEACL